MAKNSKYAVHEDFQHYPSFTFPFNRFVVSTLNAFLHVDTFFRQRHLKAKAKQHLVSSEDGYGVKVWQFDPDDAQDDEILPALVYYHGGAFVLTYASTHVEAMNFYANEARCRVFMVDYRLAPVNCFPLGFNDCYAALDWVSGNAPQLGVDANRIAVGGDSAGGAFSAGVVQRAQDQAGPRVCGQLLVYPVTDRSCSTESAKQFVDAPMFNGKANAKMWQIYLKNCPVGEVPLYASPNDRENLSGLPNAYVENAEFDPLRDEAAIYAKRLQEAGVDTEFVETKGTVHGYDTVPDSQITQDSLAKRIAFLKKVFSSDA